MKFQDDSLLPGLRSRHSIRKHSAESSGRSSEIGYTPNESGRQLSVSSEWGRRDRRREKNAGRMFRI